MVLTFLDDVTYDLVAIAEKIWLENPSRTILVSSNFTNESCSEFKFFTDYKELYDKIRELSGYDEFYRRNGIKNYNFSYDQQVIQFDVYGFDRMIGSYYVFGAPQEIIALFELELIITK